MMNKKETEKLFNYWKHELVVARTGHRRHVCQTVLGVLEKVLGG